LEAGKKKEPSGKKGITCMGGRTHPGQKPEGGKAISLDDVRIGVKGYACLGASQYRRHWGSG